MTMFKKRFHLFLLGVGLGAGLLSGCSGKKEVVKPNLLFIMTDQQRYDALSIAGNSVLKTPNLDRLAKQGVWFQNAYTQCAVCGPARSTILTGNTVEHHGVRTNSRAYYYDEKVVMTMPTFDEILSRNGYHCEYYGKWHSQTSHTEIYQNPKREASNGKSVFGPGGQKYAFLDYINEHYPKPELKEGEYYDKFTTRPYRPNPIDILYGKSQEVAKELYNTGVQPDFHGESLIPKEHSFTAFQAKETIEAIERLKDEQFSITCSFHYPHSPIIVPEPYYSMYPAEDMKPPASIGDDMKNSPYIATNGRLDLPEYSDPELIKYMISNYYGLINEIDHWVGEILATLEKNGLSENTLVIFTSDHGEMLGSHGMREKNVFYEESSHIPLMMRFPGEIKANTKVDAYVSHIDLFATILDYLEAGEYESDGKSLRDLIEGKKTGHGEYVVTEWNYRGDVAPNYMIVKDGWKLFIPYSVSSEVINAMYNLNEDPHEMNNLLGSNPEKEKVMDRAEELRASLLEWLEKMNSDHYESVKNREL